MVGRSFGSYGEYASQGWSHDVSAMDYSQWSNYYSGVDRQFDSIWVGFVYGAGLLVGLGKRFELICRFQGSLGLNVFSWIWWDVVCLNGCDSCVLFALC